MTRRRTYGFSFSWRRAVGVSAAKGRISRGRSACRSRKAAGTESWGRMVGSGFGLGVIVVVLLLLSRM